MERTIHFWAYALTCDKEIEEIAARWNEAGPWRWEIRDRFFFGVYLNTRPADGIRIHLHEFFPDSEINAMYPGPGIVDGFEYRKGFTVQLEIDAESPWSKEEIDGVLRHLLEAIGAEKIKTIEPYA